MKFVYDKLITKGCVKGVKADQWSKELSCKINKEELESCFKEIYRTTNVPKYRSFQYRLLHRAITLNIDIFRGKKRANHKCNEADKSYPHIFIFCDMYEFEDSEIEFNEFNVIFNGIVDNPRNIKHFLCLICKQYIRCFNKPSNFYELKSIIWSTKSIEKFIAIKNRKLKHFNRKWNIGRAAKLSYFQGQEIV